MHADVAPLGLLLGRWQGNGRGEYPTIKSFTYADEWEFTQNGRPFIQFSERTWNGEGQAMHVETGYLRIISPGVVEIVAALPTGQSECGRGTLSTAPLQISTDASVQNTQSAKQVDRIVRRFSVHGDQLSYRMDMEAVSQGLTLHLTSTLRRVG